MTEMTKLKVRGLKWKRLKVRGLVLHFCQKKKNRERALEKKKRENESCVLEWELRTAFLNEEDKENKIRGIEIRTTCTEEKKKEKKKKTHGWNKGWERRNSIMNKKF